MTGTGNKLTFWILISTMIISVGAGHGIAPIIVIQYWTLFNDVSDIWIFPSILFSTGQLSLLASIFISSQRMKKLLLLSGILISGLGTGNMVLIGMEDYNSAMPTYITGLPFVIIAAIRIFRRDAIE